MSDTPNFQSLKELRENKGISLEEISQKTKINIKILTAIESGDFNVLPDVYVRSILKVYANEIGVSIDEIMSFYDKSTASRDYSIQIGTDEGTIKSEAEPMHIPPSKRYLLWVPLVVIVITAILSIKFFTESGSEDIPKPVSEKPFNEVIKDVKTDIEKNIQSLPADTTPVVVQQTGLRLGLKAIQRVWVRSVTDEEDTSEFTLNPGEIKNMSGEKNFKLIIGNSAGLEIFLNDRSFGTMANQAIITWVLLDSTGIKRKVVLNPKKTTQPAQQNSQ
jgi:cytoskeletal protein RodZ